MTLDVRGFLPQNLNGMSRFNTRKRSDCWRALALTGGVLASVTNIASALQADTQVSPNLVELLAKQVPLDVNSDGFAELASARVLTQRRVDDVARRPVLVIVEPRLLSNSLQRDTDPLPAALERLTVDIAADFGEAHLIALECPPAPRHQDGLYVLALRRVLRAYASQEPQFAGVVFVGHFPEAMLVRSCNWRIVGPLTLHSSSGEVKTFEQPVPYLRTMAELVAHRCETVLADLDGDWESRYVLAETSLPWSIGVFPQGVPADGGWTTDFETGAVSYEDFFHVDDGALERKFEVVLAEDGSKTPRLFLDPLDELADRECSAADRARKNPLSVPDILVSRIDPRGVAYSLHTDLRDGHGQPKAGKVAGKLPTNWYSDPWVADAGVELDLLLEYLDRNHAYRSATTQVGFRPASISHGLPSGFNELRAASPAWKDIDAAGLDQSEVDLCAVAQWLQTPAVLRTIRAHSDPWGCVFAPTDVTKLTQIAGPPWSFAIQAGELVPSLGPACAGGKLDFFLLKTLHANARTGHGASFYLHTGCEAISPAGSATLPFSDPNYGVRNGAESLLFLADGLALVGRAKVFYDEPRGFCEALAAGGSFGAAWKRYFEVESAAASWSEVGDDIGRKRAYFWSVLGDWTLRLQAPPR